MTITKYFILLLILLAFANLINILLFSEISPRIYTVSSATELEIQEDANLQRTVLINVAVSDNNLGIFFVNFADFLVSDGGEIGLKIYSADGREILSTQYLDHQLVSIPYYPLGINVESFSADSIYQIQLLQADIKMDYSTRINVMTGYQFEVNNITFSNMLKIIYHKLISYYGLNQKLMFFLLSLISLLLLFMYISVNVDLQNRKIEISNVFHQDVFEEIKKKKSLFALPLLIFVMMFDILGHNHLGIIYYVTPMSVIIYHSLLARNSNISIDISIVLLILYMVATIINNQTIINNIAIWLYIFIVLSIIKEFIYQRFYE